MRVPVAFKIALGCHPLTNRGTTYGKKASWRNFVVYARRSPCSRPASPRG
jgi:hypothetical protein